VLSLTLLAFGAALSSPVSDGERFVAIQRTPQTIEIRDDAKHLKRTLNLPCRPVSISRAGALLTECSISGTGANYTLVDLVGGQWRHFEATTSFPGYAEAFASASRAGRQWVQVTDQGYHWGVTEYRNLNTGEVRKLSSAGVMIDLDSPGLTRPLCAPLQLPAESEMWEHISEDVSGPRPFDDYDGKVAAVNGLSSHDPHRDYDALLWRCGDKRPQRLRDASHLSAGGNWASWIVGTAGWAQRLKDNQRVKLSRKLDQVVHTKVAVYGTRNGKVFRARLKIGR